MTAAAKGGRTFHLAGFGMRMTLASFVPGTVREHARCAATQSVFAATDYRESRLRREQFYGGSAAAMRCGIAAAATIARRGRAKSRDRATR